MENLSDNSVSTTLSQSLPSPNMDPRASIELELLRTQPLKNEEIIEILAFLCQAETIDPYIEHVIVLRNNYDMTLEVRPLEIEILSLREKFTLKALRNFFVAIGDVGYHGLIMQVITMYQLDPSCSVYLLNLEEIFAVQPDELFVRDVLRVINNSEMEGPGVSAAEHLFEGKLRRISQYAPIPTYIQSFNIIVGQLPKLEPSDIEEDITPEVIAQYIEQRLENMGQQLEVPEGSNSEDVLIEMVNRLTTEEYNELVNKLTIDPEEVRRIRGHPDIFRVYGPVNAYPDTDFTDLTNEEDPSDTDVNLIFGGARMFTDLSQEIDDETSVPLDDWFVGYCMQCSLRIKAYHHAVREPGLLGGWSGCFCSWECVRGSIRDGKSNYIFDGDAEDPSKLNIYALQLALTIQIENNMLEIGISDRDYDFEEEDEEDAELTIRQEQLNQDFVNSLIANIESLDFNAAQPLVL